MYIDHNVLFFPRLHFCPYGVLPPQILHALEIDQNLLPHTPRGTGVVPKILIVKI